MQIAAVKKCVFSIDNKIIACFILTLFFSCKATSYFKTPNDVNKVYGTIDMMDGTVKKGLITIDLENYHVDYQMIHIDYPEKGGGEDLKFTDIFSFKVDGATYVPKKIDIHLTGHYDYLFVKRLTSRQDKMQLYELHQMYKSNDVGEETYYYYISFAGDPVYNAIDINSDRIIPGFDKKMSAMVADCPALAAKIQEKRNGYYYSFLSLRSKKINVIQRIVKEYSACK